MADKRKLIDVWITEGNVVYREVPYTVVTDWVQEGRLLEDDHLRPAGTEKWHRLGDVSAFAAFLPKVDPYSSNDQAEAMAPVEVDFHWKQHGEEDDDPDMIPLIDISLVLLIFFMMTASVVVAANQIDVPKAKIPWAIETKWCVWVGIDKDKDNQPLYSVGQKEAPAGPEDRGLTESQAVRRVKELTDTLAKERGDKVYVRIAADKQLPCEVVMRLAGQLDALKTARDGRISEIKAEVGEQKQ
ncbi:MAG TPA: biopolymer transporter ExbD [Isosphaeraceae bacterium]|nr:biopolymer transporter ExbD [Isosphaeraceae bacterium]